MKRASIVQVRRVVRSLFDEESLVYQQRRRVNLSTLLVAVEAVKERLLWVDELMTGRQPNSRWLLNKRVTKNSKENCQQPVFGCCRCCRSSKTVVAVVLMMVVSMDS